LLIAYGPGLAAENEGWLSISHGKLQNHYGAAVSDTDDVWRVSGCRGGNTEKDQSLGQALIAAALGVENVFMGGPYPLANLVLQNPGGGQRAGGDCDAGHTSP
jgi:hypothetical protein